MSWPIRKFVRSTSYTYTYLYKIFKLKMARTAKCRREIYLKQHLGAATHLMLVDLRIHQKF